MKKIKLDGKLKLNKETIAKLNDDQMNEVKGGAGTSIYGCPSNTASRRSNNCCLGDGTSKCGGAWSSVG